MRRLPRCRKTLAALVVAGLLVAWAAVPHDFNMIGILVRSLLYFPTHDVAYPLTAFGPGAEEVRFGDGGQLHGVYVPPPADGTGLTVVVFHGNGGNLNHRAPMIARMHRELRAGLFIFDYQGYGQSRGRPSEAATRSDGRAAIAYLRGRADVDADRLAYYGESLGGAVAIELATVAPPAALIVQSSFTSIADMAATHYPLLRGLLPLARVSYDSLATLPTLRVPLLVVHGDADTLVPVEHARRIFAAANEPKRLYIVPGAGHNDVQVRGGPELWAELRAFVDLAVGAQR